MGCAISTVHNYISSGGNSLPIMAPCVSFTLGVRLAWSPLPLPRRNSTRRAMHRCTVADLKTLNLLQHVQLATHATYPSIYTS